MYISIEKELNTYNNILRFDKFLIYYSVYKGWLYMVNIRNYKHKIIGKL